MPADSGGMGAEPPTLTPFRPRLALAWRPGVEIVRCAPAAIIGHRIAVLEANGAEAETAFIEDADPESIHLSASIAGVGVVGCASYLPSWWERRPAWRLRGMAVATPHRGLGIGSGLLGAMERELQAGDSSRPLAWCTARLAAVGFYERMGWRAASTIFDAGWAGPSIVMTTPCARPLGTPFAA